MHDVKLGHEFAKLSHGRIAMDQCYNGGFLKRNRRMSRKNLFLARKSHHVMNGSRDKSSLAKVDPPNWWINFCK